MAVVDGDYNDLKKYNLAELTSNPEEKEPSNGPSRLTKKEGQKDTVRHDQPEVANQHDSVVDANSAHVKDETGDIQISSKEHS